MRKKLLRLEAAFQVVRHITEPYVQNLLAELATMLASGGVAAGGAGSRSASSSSEGSQGDGGGDGCGFFYFGELFQDAEVQTEDFEVKDAFVLAGDSLGPVPSQVHGSAAASGLNDENSHRVDTIVGDAQVFFGKGGGSDSTEAGDLPMAASLLASGMADDAAGEAGRSSCRFACVPEAAVGSGGLVGFCCHRLLAARGGEARGAGWPGGGPAGSPGHDNDDGPHQKSTKEHVIDLLPAVGSGGLVGACCHRLTAARGSEARDAGGPGGAHRESRPRQRGRAQPGEHQGVRH
jgi:hypothetical protein